MDKKTLTIILAIVLIAAFFLPYFNLAGIFKISGFDIVAGKDFNEGSGKGGGSAERFVILLWPLAGVLLLIGAVSNENYILGKTVLGILALIGLLYLVIRMAMEGGEVMKYIFRFLGIGFWLALAAAVVVLVYNPRKQTSNA